MGEDKRTIVFSVAGRSYRVVTTASAEEIHQLAKTVDERLRSIAGSRPPGIEAFVLTAVSLAHDAASQKKRADDIAQGARNVMGKVLDRIDAATPPVPIQADSIKDD
jgi:cell division protein ZapA (FtsZ GTPase activity inhibitor)